MAGDSAAMTLLALPLVGAAMLLGYGAHERPVLFWPAVGLLGTAYLCIGLWRNIRAGGRYTVVQSTYDSKAGAGGASPAKYQRASAQALQGASALYPMFDRDSSATLRGES